MFGVYTICAQNATILKTISVICTLMVTEGETRIERRTFPQLLLSEQEIAITSVRSAFDAYPTLNYYECTIEQS